MTNFARENFNAGAHELLVWMPMFGLVFLLLIVWSILWKGLALWHAAQRGESGWFIAVLLLNTAGILEIVYLFGVLKLKFSELFHKK